MNLNISPEDSIFFQSIASCNFLMVLQSRNFQNDNFYKSNIVDNENFWINDILEKSGYLGNPAIMQAMFYLLLVVPKEALSRIDSSFNKKLETLFNKKATNLNPEVNTQYDNEDQSNISTVNFFNHIRNSVAHAYCTFTKENNEPYVTFHDENPKDIKQNCDIKFKTIEAGELLALLDVEMKKLLSNKFNISLKRIK